MGSREYEKYNFVTPKSMSESCSSTFYYINMQFHGYTLASNHGCH